MSFDVVQASELVWEERPAEPGREPRRHAVLTEPTSLTQSRARMWRYPPHTEGRRHLDPDQEEVFVPLSGTLTALLGDPPERFEVGPGGIIVVHQGTAMQLRNDTDDDVVFFAYGAPPITGNATFL